jgi:hypothetical protein
MKRREVKIEKGTDLNQLGEELNKVNSYSKESIDSEPYNIAKEQEIINKLQGIDSVGLSYINPIEYLEKLTKTELMAYIRGRLTVNQKKQSFDFSGYESKTGECTLKNQGILNIFSDLGIYDYTTFLFLDFYKGTPTIFFQYFSENEVYKISLDGCSTSEIIYSIFQITIFSGKYKRRRL